MSRSKGQKIASHVEVQVRILKFADAIASGFMRTKQLIAIAHEEDWGISDRMIQEYIAKARELFKEREIDSIDIKRRKRIKQLEHLAMVNYDQGNYQETRHCIKALSDIEGLVKSRFRDEEDTNAEGLAVVSRFGNKWKKVSGE